MAFGQGRRRNRIGKVLRPVPVLNFRHVFKVLAYVDMMRVKRPVEYIDEAVILDRNSRNTFQRIDRQTKPAKFI